MSRSRPETRILASTKTRNGTLEGIAVVAAGACRQLGDLVKPGVTRTSGLFPKSHDIRQRHTSVCSPVLDIQLPLVDQLDDVGARYPQEVSSLRCCQQSIRRSDHHGLALGEPLEQVPKRIGDLVG